MRRPRYKQNRVLKTLTLRLGTFLETSRLGELLISETFSLGEDIRRAPDVAVILGDRRAELENMKVIHIVPEIAIEVLSPNETRRIIQRKLGQYFKPGVKEVWPIDPDTREAEVWTGPQLPEDTLGEGVTITSVLLPGSSLRIADLFS